MGNAVSGGRISCSLRTRFAYNGLPVCFFMSISYTVAGKLYIVLIRCRHRNE